LAQHHGFSLSPPRTHLKTSANNEGSKPKERLGAPQADSEGQLKTALVTKRCQQALSPYLRTAKVICIMLMA
jgi:hypothetical protein